MADSALDPADYWREPSSEISAGDVFVDIPQLSLRDDARPDERDEIYLATRRVELALLLKILPGSWWFVPVLTPASFGDRGLFDDVFADAVHGGRPGWTALPPLDPAFPPLAGSALIYTLRPTVHRPDAFDDAHGMRVASLTSSAYEQVCNAFVDGFLNS